MSTMNPEFVFKGEPFANRYRLTGILTAQSPIHIGTGERRVDLSQFTSDTHKELIKRIVNGYYKEAEQLLQGLRSKEQKEKAAEEREDHYIDEIARDGKGLPYIPGSTLRGVVRNYLLQIFREYPDQGKEIACDRSDKEIDKLQEELKKITSQEERLNWLKQQLSLLEQVFGTTLSESKIEFWDNPLRPGGEVHAPELAGKGWETEQPQSYVVRSVAIDPITGAAEPNKLYAFDVVPKGAQFSVTITGQNLNAIELGFVLFGLDGFNSKIYPLTIGAMAGRGFGRMKFEVTEIACLNKDGLQGWIEKAISTDHVQAGYESLPVVNKDTLIRKFKDALQNALKKE
jgi:CRISPR/Cas system CSM-associated protein Csm3 (group 7 of RAMP superfamily)